jgi:hypothetical protein
MGRELDAYVTDLAAFSRWLGTGDPWAAAGGPTSEVRLQRLFEEFAPYALASEGLSGAPRTLSPQAIRVTTLAMPSLNAVSTGVNGRQVIVLPEGLIAFNYAFVRALATLVTWRERPVKTPSPNETATWIARLLDQASSHRTTAVVPRFPAEAGQIRWAESVATVGECFVIAHELAHLAWGDQLANDTPEEVRNLVTELRADRIALIAVESFVTEVTVEPQVGLLATELMFRSMRLIDEFKGTRANPNRATHPPPQVRIDSLREGIEESQPDVEWHGTLPGMFEAMVADLSAKALSIAAADRARTEAAIEALLARYAVGPGLDLEKTAFRQAAFELLDVSADATLTALVRTLRADVPDESDPGWLRAMQRRILAFETLHHLDPRVKRVLGIS